MHSESNVEIRPRKGKNRFFKWPRHSELPDKKIRHLRLLDECPDSQEKKAGRDGGPFPQRLPGNGEMQRKYEAHYFGTLT